MSAGNRIVKKRCPACEREFTGTLVVCQHDGTLLIPVKESLVGQTLADKFLVLEELGQGGMSIVYKGRDEFMDRTVAIKMLQSQLLSDQTSVKRFQREAVAVAALTHPHVISVYECAVYNGQPYLVMEYLVGESLTDIIKRDNHISVDRVIQIFIKVTGALEHAHAKGVLHRDLKSSNVMLVDNEGKPDFVKVVDFGIAKIMPSSGKQSQNLTQTGEIFGSPIYMSPEQCQGLLLDVRSDIYSTGVMMYESLTGQPPLMGDTIVDTMQMHVQSQPPTLGQMRPDLAIPLVLEEIVFKALEKRPENRFQTMNEFREALEQCIRKIAEGGPMSAPAVARAPVKPRSTRQNLEPSRPPGHMPKPLLEIPEPRAVPNGARIAERAMSQESRRPAVSEPGKKPGEGQGMGSFKVSDLRRLEEKKETQRKWLLPLALVFLAIAVAALSLWLGTHSPGISPPGAESTPIN